ncbi:cytochrome P450 [Phaeosphaeria sp. MPI-PUGE-AT-0046c]|nr:cytochrome P450 [Phaeosphaeria sp. MPI-PUGE-AT-0046c]
MSIPLLASASLVLTLYLVLRSLFLPKPIPSIPYSSLSRLTPLGDLAPLGIYNLRTGRVFAWLSLQCLLHKSSIVQLFLPSFSTTHPTLVIADLDVIEEIVTKRMHEIDRAELMRSWFGVVAPKATIGLKTHDKAFKEQRKLWNVMHGHKFLEEVAAECFAETAAELGELWEGKVAVAAGMSAFEVTEDIKMTTLDGMWGLLVGTKLGLLTAKIEKLQESGALVKKEAKGTVRFAEAALPEFYGVFRTLLMLMDWVLQGISPSLYKWVFTFTGILQHFHKRKDRILDQHIAQSRQRVMTNASGRTCALDQVLYKNIRLRQSLPDNNDDIDDAALRDEILDLLITGHETTATTVSWAIKYLADTPEIQTQLRASLASALAHVSHPTQPLSARELINTSLPYLDAVIAETLRLSNTGPVSFRQTLVNCEIMGHNVPAGTPIILVTAGPSYDEPDTPSTRRQCSSKDSLHRHGKKLKTTSSEEEKVSSSIPLNLFAPERWLSDGVFVPDAVRMFPFSAGPRGCFGKKIAMLELRILIATLVMRFEFPRLAKALSGYEAQDNLTSRPQVCYVCPRVMAGQRELRQP